MQVTGWSRGLEVSGGGAGVVSHGGLVLLRHLADKTGLTGGLTWALATPRILVHDRGRVMADLACAVADGARVISDFRVMSDQRELFGLAEPNFKATAITRSSRPAITRPSRWPG